RFDCDWSSDVCSSDLHLAVQDQFPVSNIDPAIELETDLAKFGDLFEAELLVQTDTRIIRKRNAGNDRMKIAFSQFGKQGVVKQQIGRASCRERVERPL